MQRFRIFSDNESIEGETMSHSNTSMHVHFIFSTKKRKNFLQVQGLRTGLYRYISGISVKLNCPVRAIGGTSDHVHVLANLGREISTSQWVREVKKGSTAWVKRQDYYCPGFSWQQGYSAFSVSESRISHVQKYVETQEEHHRRFSYEDELKWILQLHGIVLEMTDGD